MSKFEWFLKHQEEEKAYRVSKIRIPKFGYTLLRDSIQTGKQLRRVHICKEDLFAGELEKSRVKDPFIGLDLLLIHGEITFEILAEKLEFLRKLDTKPMEVTIDMTGVSFKYELEQLQLGIRGIYRFCNEISGIKVVFTTCQFDPIDMDVIEAVVLANEKIVLANKGMGMYTPYLHRATMRAKRGKMTYRSNLWVKDAKDAEVLRLGSDGFVLYLRYLKAYHHKGFEMSTDGVCNPVTLIKAVPMLVIAGVKCGLEVIRERSDKYGLEKFEEKLAVMMGKKMGELKRKAE